MGLGKKTIDDENYCGKKVLVRCDFNVPMKDGVITNENRINAAMPTIQKLVNDGAKVILCSHLGKPKNGPEAKFSLAPVAKALSAKLGKEVVFADDDNVVGEQAKAAVAAMNNGDVVLLQNTRVIAMGQRAKNETGKPAVAKTATLEVSPVDAQKLALGQQVGDLSLVLRKPGEQDGLGSVQTVSLDDLRSGVSAGTYGGAMTATALALRAAVEPTLLVDLDPWGPGLGRVLGGRPGEGITWDDLSGVDGRLSASELASALPRDGDLALLHHEHLAELDAHQVGVEQVGAVEERVVLEADAPARVEERLVVLVVVVEGVLRGQHGLDHPDR